MTASSVHLMDKNLKSSSLITRANCVCTGIQAEDLSYCPETQKP